jgi:hypothetical protein
MVTEDSLGDERLIHSARNEEGELFGFERVSAFLQKRVSAAVHQAHVIVTALMSFSCPKPWASFARVLLGVHCAGCSDAISKRFLRWQVGTRIPFSLMNLRERYGSTFD